MSILTRTAESGARTPTARRREWSAFLLTLPAILLILALVIYPLCYSIAQSFRLRDGSIGLGHYADVLQDKSFRQALWVTIKFTGVIVASELILGLAVALCLQRLNKYLRGFFRAVFLIPLLIAPVVASYEWMWLLNDQYGLVTHVFASLGVQPPLWLSHPTWAFFTIVLVDLWIATPFAILVFQSALASLPHDIYEAAEVEGASPLQSFWYLTRPFLKPAFLVILIIRTMDAFRIYDSIAVLTGGGPGLATTSLSILALKTGINFGQLNEAAAISILTLLPILAVTLIYLRLIRLD